MYTLYYLSGTCSLATLCVLNDLQQPVRLVNRNNEPNFNTINPVGSVPVLVDGDIILREGANIMLFLLDQHKVLPDDIHLRHQVIQAIMFANATMHPAYGRLFFIAKSKLDDAAKAIALAGASAAISQLWQVVEIELQNRRFYGGDSPGAADFMLAVYSRWGAFFPVEIHIGPNAQRMIDEVNQAPAFIQALKQEAEVV